MSPPVFELEHVTVRYDRALALDDVTMAIGGPGITALVGPSGCGKSTLLRSLNRLNDLVPGAQLEGTIRFDGADIHDQATVLIDLRRRVGMVFQKPNAFPMSVYDNVAYGPRLHRQSGSMDDIVEDSLRRAGLWDEVSDDLGRAATTLSGGQQQRLVIARCLALRPEVILMDEPTASLDPLATAAIEDLARELARTVTIVLVTHDLGQAFRVADHTGFLHAHTHDDDGRHGELVEFGPTRQVFTSPADPRTREYLGTDWT